MTKVELEAALAARRIAVVGRGRRARITEADVQRLAKPIAVRRLSPEAEEAARRLMHERSVALLRAFRPNPSDVVVPFIPKGRLKS